MAFKGLDRMKKAMDKVQDLQDKDPNEMAAEKLNKEIQEVQAKQNKEFDMPRKNMPTSNDMGPTQEEVAANRAQMRGALLKGAKEGMGGKELEKAMNKKKGGAVKKYAKGGSVSSASKRADGIATKGKTRGKIC